MQFAALVNRSKVQHEENIKFNISWHYSYNKDLYRGDAGGKG